MAVDGWLWEPLSQRCKSLLCLGPCSDWGCEVFCKLGFGGFDDSSVFGEGICHHKQTQKPSCYRQILKQQKSHCCTLLSSCNSVPETLFSSLSSSPSPGLASLAVFSLSLLQAVFGNG